MLNEIKYHHPNMEDSLYKEVLRNIRNEELYEKKDKQLLFQCLPYSLKNRLIMEMYKPIIKHFDFFKGVDNTDFVVKVATSLKPLISIKGDILIHIGDLFKEIFFIKKGVIELCICIDLNDLDNSIKNCFDLIKFKEINDYTKSSYIKQKEKNKTTTIDANLDYYFSDKKENSNYNDTPKIQDIKILEKRAKQHFGESLMFLNRQSPFKAIIGTKTAELLILKKMEAIEIYSVYPNIWKRINKKSLYNLEQIYLKIRKTLNELSNQHNTKKPKKKLAYPIIIKNNTKNNNSFVNNIKKGIKNKIHKNKQKDGNKEKEKRKNNDKKKDKNKIELKKECISQNISFQNEEKNSQKKKDSLNIENKKSIYSFSNKDFNNDSNEQIDMKNNNENNHVYLSGKSSVSLSQIDNENNTEKKYNSKKIEINKEINEKDNLNKNDLKELIGEKKFNNINEKLNNNKFINLSSTTESSFQLNSSYENIHKISNYKYINNSILQKRAKQFIVNECKQKLSLLQNPENTVMLQNNSENIHLIKNNLSSRKINNDFFNKINNSFIKSQKSIKGSYLLDSRANYVSEQELSTNIPKKNISVINCSKDNLNNNLTQNKSKKKVINKKLLIGKKLSVIIKNIKNAKEAISNPNEFYVNLFNNIIQKESAANISQIQDDDGKQKRRNSVLSFRNLSSNDDNLLSINNGKIEEKLSENILHNK